jgi:hypothetical protein
MVQSPGDWRTRALLVLATFFVVGNLWNALTKGGDFTVFLESGRRLLDVEPLYAGSRVAEGVIGPPFQAVVFIPFAWLARASEPASRIAWYALNLVLLVLAILWWVRAAGTTEAAAPPAATSAAWQIATGTDVLLTLLAVAHPLQANFQHQNLNVVLLAATGAAALASRRGKDGVAGFLVGAATAVKAFPGLLLAYFLVRGRYRAVAWGAVTATALTALPALWYGPDGWQTMMRDWLQLSGSGGWPIRSHNQSLFAMIGRWLGPEGLTATGTLSHDESPVAYWAWGAAVLTLLVFGLACLRRTRALVSSAAPGGPRSAQELAVGLGVAVLISPIAWDHYWVLFFPALYVLRVLRASIPGAWGSRTFWTAAVLISGPLLFSREAWRVSRWLSVRTLAGLLVVLVLSLALAWWQRRAEPAQGQHTWSGTP